MMIFLLMFFSVSTFAQLNNVVPYVGDGVAGLQVSPVLTGVKSSVSNQETELNIALFYHDRYDLKDDDILGMIEGRLISENPISSFDLIDQLERDRNNILSNFIEKQKVYQDYLNQFRQLQREYDSSIDGTVVEPEEDEEYEEHPVDEDEYYYDEDGYYYDEDGYYDYYYSMSSLSFINQKLVAQSIPNIDTTGLMSGKELEQLIYIERLKREYEHLMELYNVLVEQQQFIDESTFDPKDPSERFTIVILGLDDPSTVWSKSFGLDGIDNYQSYNKSVWFLGYKLSITKKDISLLYNVFTKNKRVQYIVRGSKGNIDFNLSSYFINAVKELVNLFAHGKLKMDRSSDFPMLRE